MDREGKANVVIFIGTRFQYFLNFIYSYYTLIKSVAGPTMAAAEGLPSVDKYNTRLPNFHLIGPCNSPP